MTAPRKTTRPPKTATADAPAAAVAPPSVPEFRFTPERAQKFRGAPPTHKFMLNATAPGAFVDVLFMDFTNPDFLVSLPEHLLSIALGMANETKDGKLPAHDDEGNLQIDKAVQLLKDELELSRDITIRGFYNPKVYATQEEADEQSGVWVEDIQPADRRAYLFWCLSPHLQGAQQVATFPAGQVQGVAAR